MAKLQFRRGTFTNDLITSEPFFDDNINSLYIGGATTGSYRQMAHIGVSNSGSLLLTGDISASNIELVGGMEIDGTVVINGSLIVGGTPVSSGSLASILSGSLIPSTGSTYDIGSVSRPYSVIHANSALISNITASAVLYDNVNNKPTLISGSTQVLHDSSSGYVSGEHIDHTSVSITAGDGLSGGGFITATRTLTLDTGSSHFTDAIKTKLNQETVISGSSQLTSSYDTRYTLSGSISPLPDGVVSGSDQVSSSFATLSTANVFTGDGNDFEQGIVISNIITTDEWKMISTSEQNPSLIFRMYDGGYPTGSVIGNYTLNGSNTPSASTDLITVGFGSSSYAPNSTGIVSGSSQLNGTSIDNLTATNGTFTGDGSGLTGIVASGSTIYNHNFIDTSDTDLVGTIDGANTGYTSSQGEYKSSSLLVYINGQMISYGSAVTESNPGLGYFDINPAPFTDDGITISYQVGTLTPPTSSAGTVSGSDQLTGSYDIRYELSGSAVSLPDGVVSGSDQLTGSFVLSGSGVSNFNNDSSYIQSDTASYASGSLRVEQIFIMTQQSYDAIPTASVSESYVHLISDAKSYEYVQIACGSSTVPITSGSNRGFDVSPVNGIITNTFADYMDGGNTDSSTFDVEVSGSSIYSTKLTIDVNESSSRSAATPAVISTGSISTGDRIFIHAEAVPTGALLPIVTIVIEKA